MSYESDCDDYAVHGDPQRDAMEYEENAARDRFDGFADPDPCVDMVPCPDCGSYAPCNCWRDELDLEDQLDRLLADDHCPVCGDHDPYAKKCGCCDNADIPF